MGTQQNLIRRYAYPKEAVRDARLDEERHDALRAAHAPDVREVIRNPQSVFPAHSRPYVGCLYTPQSNTNTDADADTCQAL